jgi:hypothetical protein
VSTMNPFSFGSDPSVTKKCPHCDTALEFESAGQLVVFTAHDDAFCDLATRERVRMLEQVLLAQREAYERAIERHRRWFDKILADNKLPSLAERAAHAELKRHMAERQHLDAEAVADMFSPSLSPRG